MAMNLERQLVFYGAYHHDPVNIAIHTVCVPLLLMTGILIASSSPNLPLPPEFMIPNYPINLGTIAAAAYSLLYVLMEPVAGMIAAPIIIGGASYMNLLLQLYGTTAVKWAIAVHIISWLAQFVGHGKFEGRAPALMDNLVQALFLAPFFVWFEILFSCGYRPELKARLDKAIEAEVKKFNSTKKPNGLGKKEL